MGTHVRGWEDSACCGGFGHARAQEAVRDASWAAEAAVRASLTVDVGPLVSARSLCAHFGLIFSWSASGLGLSTSPVSVWCSGVFRCADLYRRDRLGSTEHHSSFNFWVCRNQVFSRGFEFRASCIV